MKESWDKVTDRWRDTVDRKGRERRRKAENEVWKEVEDSKREGRVREEKEKERIKERKVQEQRKDMKERKRK